MKNVTSKVGHAGGESDVGQLAAVLERRLCDAHHIGAKRKAGQIGAIVERFESDAGDDVGNSYRSAETVLPDERDGAAICDTRKLGDGARREKTKAA